MKLHVGDSVLITAGKDRGKKGEVTRVMPKQQTVIVAGMNMYTRHIKPNAGQPGDKVRRERAMPMSKVAIINDKGQRDRVGYTLTKDGKRQRIFRKTGTIITIKKPSKQPAKPAKK